MEPVLSLRPENENDLPFLVRVYASTRADELALTDWNEDQKAAFVTMQFNAQRSYYLEHYPGAQFQVIEVGGAPAGRLYLHRRTDEIRIMDIALLPEFRGRGIGTQLLQAVLIEGQQTRRKVTIHVEQFNPALRLYQRLGFQQVELRGVHLFLAWQPEPE